MEGIGGRPRSPRRPGAALSELRAGWAQRASYNGAFGPDMIGETVTHYRILDKIGEGGMGVVYRAEDTRLGRQVAVKFLSAKLSQDPLALERFQREARAASSLNHPHICALYRRRPARRSAVPRHGAAGRDHAAPADRAGTAADGEVLDFGVQIADALDAAHALGIVHRDIKSANIFVTERGQIKILDFGLAKLAHPRGTPVDPYSDTILASPVDRRPTTGQTLGHAVVHVAGAGARRRPRSREAICSRSAWCSTRWRPATSRSPAEDVGARVRCDPASGRRRRPSRSIRTSRPSSTTSSQGAREGSRSPLPDRRRAARRSEAPAARERAGATMVDAAPAIPAAPPDSKARRRAVRALPTALGRRSTVAKVAVLARGAADRRGAGVLVVREIDGADRHRLDRRAAVRRRLAAPAESRIPDRRHHRDA